MKRDKETGDSVVTGFGFESDRLRFWRGCFGTITNSSMARTMHFHFRHLLNTALLLSVTGRKKKKTKNAQSAYYWQHL